MSGAQVSGVLQQERRSEGDDPLYGRLERPDRRRLRTGTAQRVQASETLLRKLLPDLKATEITGADGAPLIGRTRRVELLGTMEAARLILAALREGVEAEAELDEMGAPTIDAEPVLIPSPEDAENAETPPVPPCTQRGGVPLCGVQYGSDAKRT